MKRDIIITDKNDNLINGEIDIRQKDAYISLDDTILGDIEAIKEQLDKIKASIIPVININEVSSSGSPYATKAALQTALGVSADDLEKILAGECTLNMEGYKFSNVAGSPTTDWSTLGMVEYSSITHDWDLGYWYANDITIIGSDGFGYALIVNKNVKLTVTP